MHAQMAPQAETQQQCWKWDVTSTSGLSRGTIVALIFTLSLFLLQRLTRVHTDCENGNAGTFNV